MPTTRASALGTVYRRFPDKAQLIDALFKERIEEFAELMNSALDDPDPWPAFARFLEQSLELQAKDRGWIFHPPFHNVLWPGRLALSASHLILLGRDLRFAVATAGR